MSDRRTGPGRRAGLLPVVLVLAAGCGGGSEGYEREVSALCREFNGAGFAGHVEIAQARKLYKRLGDGLARLSPPGNLRRTHDVLLSFARGGERLFGGPRDPDAPRVDLRLTVGDWQDDVPFVKREVPACGDTLAGRHPEIQVIR